MFIILAILPLSVVVFGISAIALLEWFSVLWASSCPAIHWLIRNSLTISGANVVFHLSLEEGALSAASCINNKNNLVVN